MSKPGISALHDRRVGLAAGITVGAAVASWLPATALVSARARRLFDVRATLDRRDAVALTFDDGPHPEGTRAILEGLEEARAPATFFLVGEQVERYPELAAAIVAGGHQIGIHCHRHRNLMRLTPRQVADDLRRAAEVIATAAGVEPRYYRPPYGVLTTPALLLARAHGWQTVLWRREGADWEVRATPRSIADRILRHVAPGDVLLLHDADHYSSLGSWRRTRGALDVIFAELGRLGLRPAQLEAPVVRWHAHRASPP